MLLARVRPPATQAPLLAMTAHEESAPSSSSRSVTVGCAEREEWAIRPRLVHRPSEGRARE